MLSGIGCLNGCTAPVFTHSPMNINFNTLYYAKRIRQAIRTYIRKCSPNQATLQESLVLMQRYVIALYLDTIEIRTARTQSELTKIEIASSLQSVPQSPLLRSLFIDAPLGSPRFCQFTLPYCPPYNSSNSPMSLLRSFNLRITLT